MGKNDLLIDDLNKELKGILDFWIRHTIDEQFGGFAGEVDASGNRVAKVDKGLVLNARILWSFSAAYNHLKDPKYLEWAHRAYDYLVNNFWDQENGGLFWAVDYEGKVSDDRKQIYGQGFGIYGFSEYYRATGKKESLEYAAELFELIEKYSYDARQGGYLEALSVNWEPMEDMRLSLKDANSPKSMNTHLHILEPYSNLYRVWPEEALKDRMKSLVRVFLDKILNTETGHFHLFFDMDWSVQSNTVSYGHDIEGAWLINEAAELVGDEVLLKEAQQKTLKMVDVFMKEGIADDSSVWYEKDLDTGHLDTDRHWWVQGEALVGLLDAYGHSGKQACFGLLVKIWSYIKNHVIDHDKGEWHELVKDDGLPYGNQVKAGFWKCPYHNTRALIECIQRIQEVHKDKELAD
ncbi:N-acyl-D-glucosamine 2-epimerase [Marinilabilia rubra]|uniref:Cellobiose 2-epimerase n=2 Tax=Marinilabilia rubra TaxID=2162893 RepID=A0A2U2B8Z0_9BACT|nr:N-acyl-D-glucosamine 2-epimerase [Marinilabilia rubra]